jgi:plastocyanin
MHISFVSRLRTAVVASLALAAVVGGSAVQAAPADQNVSIDRFAFSPAEVTVGVGTSVVWTNQQSGVPHTSTSLDGLWDSDVLATNKTFSFTFNQSGDFAYQCDIHPSMRGVVHVTADTSAEPTSGSVLDQSESTSSTVSATAQSDAATPVPTSVPTPVVEPTPTPGSGY